MLPCRLACRLPCMLFCISLSFALHFTLQVAFLALSLLFKLFFLVLHCFNDYLVTRRRNILERLGSARIYYESNFPAFFARKRARKSLIYITFVQIWAVLILFSLYQPFKIELQNLAHILYLFLYIMLQKNISLKLCLFYILPFQSWQLVSVRNRLLRTTAV